MKGSNAYRTVPDVQFLVCVSHFRCPTRSVWLNEERTGKEDSLRGLYLWDGQLPILDSLPARTK